MQTQQALTRRRFVLYSAAIAVIGPSFMLSGAARAAAEELSLRTLVPTRIYFPERRRDSLGLYGVEVTTLALTSDVLSVRFADGAAIELPADIAATGHRRDGRGLAALQVKNLAAWLFDAMRQSLGLRAFAGSRPDLAGDFAELQTGRVLDSVTPRAVWNLLVALQERPEIERLQWTGSRFELSSAAGGGSRGRATRRGAAGRRRGASR